MTSRPASGQPTFKRSLLFIICFLFFVLMVLMTLRFMPQNGTDDKAVPRFAAVPAPDETAENAPAAIESSSQPARCATLSAFSDEPWFNDLEKIYIDKFLIATEKLENAEKAKLDGDQQACLIGNDFIFIAPYSQWGCGFILGYDTHTEQLNIPEIESSLLGGNRFSECASKITGIGEDRVSITGGMGDGECFSNVYGAFYFKENNLELSKGCQECAGKETVCYEAKGR